MAFDWIAINSQECSYRLGLIDYTLPQKSSFLSLLGNNFPKKREFIAEYFIFRKLSPFCIFSPEKKAGPLCDIWKILHPTVKTAGEKDDPNGKVAVMVQKHQLPHPFSAFIKLQKIFADVKGRQFKSANTQLP